MLVLRRGREHEEMLECVFTLSCMASESLTTYSMGSVPVLSSPAQVGFVRNFGINWKS